MHLRFVGTQCRALHKTFGKSSAQWHNLQSLRSKSSIGRNLSEQELNNGDKPSIVNRLIDKHDDTETLPEKFVVENALREMTGMKANQHQKDLNSKQRLSQQTLPNAFTDLDDGSDISEWVKAFEHKVDNSHTRYSKRRVPSMFRVKQDHRFHPIARQSAAHPLSGGATPTSRTVNDMPIPNDVDKDWVEAFERKAGLLSGHGAQTKTFKDTFSPGHTEQDPLEFVDMTKDGDQQDQMQKTIEDSTTKRNQK